MDACGFFHTQAIPKEILFKTLSGKIYFAKLVSKSFRNGRNTLLAFSTKSAWSTLSQQSHANYETLPD